MKGKMSRKYKKSHIFKNTQKQEAITKKGISSIASWVNQQTRLTADCAMAGIWWKMNTKATESVKRLKVKQHALMLKFFNYQILPIVKTLYVFLSLSIILDVSPKCSYFVFFTVSHGIISCIASCPCFKMITMLFSCLFGVVWSDGCY